MSKYILPESVKRWLAKSVAMEDLPKDYPFPAMVKLTPYGYIISIRSDIPQGDERDTLLSHEVGHILRGDLLVKNVNPIVWNIAADACINSVLDRDIVRGLRGVDYDAVSKEFDLNPEQAPGAKVIYDLLKENVEQQISQGMMDLHEGMEGNEGECKKAHIKTILEAINEGVLDESIIKSAGKYGNSSNVIAVPKRQPLLETWLLALRSAKIGGTPARYRSWIRPGRIPGMKGNARLPRARVAVLADVSGSVVSMLPQILGAAKALQKVCNVKVMVWATEADWYRGPESVSKVGGGTQLCSAFKLVNNYDADAVVVITDGELADSGPSQNIAPKCPLIWCLTENAKAPWKRPRDKVLELV